MSIRIRGGYSRPEKPVEQWCTKRIHVRDGVEFAEFQPGDGTRYSVLLTSIGNEEVSRAVGCAPDAVLVTLTNFDHKSMFVGHGDCIHYSYIQEKLGITSISSAVTLAICISMLVDGRAVTWDEFEGSIREAV
jgi:hypothetical protein